MKKIGLVIFAFIFLLVGCNETSSTVCNLSSESISKVTTDSMVIYVESYGTQIELKGDLNLSKGKCTISLKVPSGDSITVDSTFVNDTIFSIDSIINLTDTIFKIDSIFIADTILTNDTIIKYKFIYNQSFIDSNTFTIDEKFDRVLGKWTFIYKSEKIDDVDPEGDLNFVLKYND
jgi:hypothetical protein